MVREGVLAEATAGSAHPAMRHTGRGHHLRVRGVEAQAQRVGGLHAVWDLVLGRAGSTPHHAFAQCLPGAGVGRRETDWGSVWSEASKGLQVWEGKKAV